MELGTGIAIAGISFSGMGISIALFNYLKASKSPCQFHAMLDKQILNIENWLEKVEAKLDRVIESKIKEESNGNC